MTHYNKFVFLFISINLALLTFILGLNYYIDPESNHHLPSDAYVFPRTTGQSAPSKLFYIFHTRPDSLFFGSSRVEIGLPPNNNIIGSNTVYNAGISGTPLKKWARFAEHVLSTTPPRNIVIGLAYSEFYSNNEDAGVNFEELLTFDIDSYTLHRFFYDVKKSLSLDTTLMSIKSFASFVSNTNYDDLPGPMSIKGQNTDYFMSKIMSGKNGIGLFKKRISAGYELPNLSVESNSERIWQSFKQVLAKACAHDVQTRIYIHPMHALRELAIEESGQWSNYEMWKTALATVVGDYEKQSCDIRVFDFSGFNDITTESIENWSPESPMKYYWEASHYRSNVGQNILKVLFNGTSENPMDFGHELRVETLSTHLEKIRQDKERFKITHKNDITLAKSWLNR